MVSFSASSTFCLQQNNNKYISKQVYTEKGYDYHNFLYLNSKFGRKGPYNIKYIKQNERACFNYAHPKYNFP